VAVKVGRNPRVTEFVQAIDARRKESTLQAKKQWRERTRIRPLDAPASKFVGLPQHAPLDYFDPDFYAQLTNKVRRKITEDPPLIALPPPSVPVYGVNKADRYWKLKKSDFMSQYGNQVLAQYDLADDEVDEEDEDDIEFDDDSALMDDDLNNDEDEGMVDDDEDVGQQRDQWAAAMHT
jgi:hypothetical protein